MGVFEMVPLNILQMTIIENNNDVNNFIDHTIKPVNMEYPP